MYEVIKEPRRMTVDEIHETFKGKWVYLVRPEGPLFSFFETAIPMVIADIPYEGKETGLYARIQDEYDGDTMSITYLMGKYNVFGFSEVLMDDEN